MELVVQKRTQTGKKIKNLRKQDIIPCVVYGKYIDAPVNLLCNKQEFLKVYKQVGYSMPITLKGGDGMDQLALIHDVQVDPVSNFLIHIDFLTLKKGQKVETEVQLVLEGLAPIEKLGLGRVQLVKSEVSIEALPQNLPHDIKVDVSKLENMHDVIFVRDLIVGTGVTITDDMDLPVVTILSLNDEEETTDTVATDTTTETPST